MCYFCSVDIYAVCQFGAAFDNLVEWGKCGCFSLRFHGSHAQQGEVFLRRRLLGEQECRCSCVTWLVFRPTVGIRRPRWCFFWESNPVCVSHFEWTFLFSWCCSIAVNFILVSKLICVFFFTKLLKSLIINNRISFLNYFMPLGVAVEGSNKQRRCSISLLAAVDFSFSFFVK